MMMTSGVHYGSVGGSPNDDGKGIDDGQAESNNDNNDQASGDPVGGPHGPTGSRG